MELFVQTQWNKYQLKSIYLFYYFKKIVEIKINTFLNLKVGTINET